MSVILALGRMRQEDSQELEAILDFNVTFELLVDRVPKAAEKLPCSEHWREWIGSYSHTVIPGFMCQGSDVTHHSATGGRSIYRETFKDENFILNHLGCGVLSMANAGPNINGSHFFFPCAAKIEQLDGSVDSGEGREGMNIVEAMECLGTRMARPAGR